MTSEPASNQSKTLKTEQGNSAQPVGPPSPLPRNSGYVSGLPGWRVKTTRRCRHEQWRPIPGHPGHRVSDSGRFAGAGNLLLSTSGGRVHLAGKSYNPAQLVLEVFGHPRPSPRHMALRRDFDQANIALANLYWGTATDRERAKFGLSAQPGCLTVSQVRVIRQRCAAGELQKKVAAELGISSATVSNIIRGRTWKWLK